MRRREVLMACGWAPWAAGVDARELSPIDPRRRLQSPRDHGAHSGVRTEWWYLTGWAGTWDRPTHGFQITFFRHRTGLAQNLPGRLAPRQLLFAHAAITDLATRRHEHADRIARWSGEDDPSIPASASSTDADVRIGRWRLRRDTEGNGSPSTASSAASMAASPAPSSSGASGSVWRIEAQSESLGLTLQSRATQPWLLQGQEGFSRKGPQIAQASHYITEPQLSTRGQLRLGSQPAVPVSGVGWMDHEWSEALLDPQAVGWDWIGMNLLDGSALTAFRLRRADGSALWAGGSWRKPGGAAQAFETDAVRWTPGRTWRSPGSNALYPVEWTVDTPAGRHTVRSLLDSQELDSRRSTGTVYWEGLSELLDERGQRVGLGYLEMTGYAGRLRL